MISITQSGVIIKASAISALQDEFERTGIAMLPGFLTSQVLAPLMKKLEQVSFQKKFETSASGSVFGTTMFVPLDDPLLASWYFMINRPELFSAVQEITNCPTPLNFFGRIHRTLPDPSQHIDWHHDISDTRVLGLNINLSRSHFSGGVFQLRDPEGNMRKEVQSWALGDAFLFRITPDWHHRLTAVSSGERTVGVGWFRTSPDWRLALSQAKFRNSDPQHRQK